MPSGLPEVTFGTELDGRRLDSTLGSFRCMHKFRRLRIVRKYWTEMAEKGAAPGILFGVSFF